MSVVFKIALGGTIGAGKTHVANMIKRKWPSTEVLSFADPVKLIAGFAQTVVGSPQTKDRHLLRLVGNEWGRAQNPDIWLDILRQKYESRVAFGQTKFVIDDVRFKNEFEWLSESQDWIKIWLERDGVIQIDPDCHVGGDLRRWDYVIKNDDNIEAAITSIILDHQHHSLQ